MNEKSALHLFFRPLTYIYLYIFLIITTIHQQIPILSSLPLELICFLFAIIFSLVDRLIINNKFFIRALILALVAVVIPLISSLVNNDQLQVILEGEYRSFFKIVMLVPLLLFYVDTPKKVDELINLFILSFGLLGLIFLYRFLILNEVRDYDLRPLLRMKNGDPNFLSTYFTACVPFSLYRYGQSRQVWKGMMYAALTAFFILCTIMNQSRMGIIALVVTLLMMMFLLKWRYRLSLFFIAISLPLGSLFFSFGNKILLRFRNMDDTSNVDRLKTLNAGIRTFLESPWFGVGWNKSSQYYYQFSEYPAFQSTTAPYEVHNTLLKIGSETGLLGMSLYCVVLILVAAAILQAMKRNKELAIINMAVITSLMINTMTISAGYKDIYIFLLIVIFIFSSATFKVKESMVNLLKR